MLYGKEHVQRYQETDGAEGHDWNNTTTLLLTTKGRKSGKSYTTPLIYQRHGRDYIVVASKGGDPDHPEWYKNLQADPEVEVQVKADKFRARARTATDEERPELWRLMAATWPDYDNYQQKTDRKIPIVVLERITT
ncbi:nitroreductase family deazaflavin-dependent oxidoreductase [Nonomuraea sp. NEAU-A123]|uniref:nitroreductase family deazaflavin-dependent oxidoreductase n=1 Tax=Nonomuraea sp. NEAU-A123 TaxID=2839649 RepID=UPI001BE41A84|nr:nitroreductase family deazaflavin-dependent oxidoreductase [Nonomuraea sp. NEAU-A123]MBT2229971.1 nitroreductase family deazaflavin-dependent oxidoreductase [Nonomuraea sp. NEAU-A123]